MEAPKKILNPFYKGTQPLQTGSIWNLSNWGLLLKERICFLWEQILSFISSLQTEGR